MAGISRSVRKNTIPTPSAGANSASQGTVRKLRSLPRTQGGGVAGRKISTQSSGRKKGSGY